VSSSVHFAEGEGAVVFEADVSVVNEGMAASGILLVEILGCVIFISSGVEGRSILVLISREDLSVA
jgi:hypothetical protein